MSRPIDSFQVASASVSLLRADLWHFLQTRPAPIAATPPIAAAPRRGIPADVLVALESRPAVADEAPSVPDAPALDEMPLQPLDLDTMKERYPLLRNML